MLLLYMGSNYDQDLQNFSDDEKLLKKYAIEQVVTQAPKGKSEQMHKCMLCQRYSNSDSLGVVVHIVKSHKDILRLIKNCR